MEAVKLQVSEGETVSYHLVLRGSLEELYPFLSFRADRKNGRHGRKVLKCPTPNCNGRLTDIDEETKVEVVRKPAHSDVKCQSYIKCKKCGNEIGINYI